MKESYEDKDDDVDDDNDYDGDKENSDIHNISWFQVLLIFFLEITRLIITLFRPPSVDRVCNAG